MLVGCTTLRRMKFLVAPRTPYFNILWSKPSAIAKKMSPKCGGKNRPFRYTCWLGIYTQGEFLCSFSPSPIISKLPLKIYFTDFWQRASDPSVQWRVSKPGSLAQCPHWPAASLTHPSLCWRGQSVPGRCRESGVASDLPASKQVQTRSLILLL